MGRQGGGGQARATGALEQESGHGKALRVHTWNGITGRYNMRSGKRFGKTRGAKAFATRQAHFTSMHSPMQMA